MAGLEWLK